MLEEGRVPSVSRGNGRQQGCLGGDLSSFLLLGNNEVWSEAFATIDCLRTKTLGCVVHSIAFGTAALPAKGFLCLSIKSR